MQNGVCPMNLSDHYPIFAARKKFKQKGSKTKLRARKYKNLDEIALISDLTNSDWNIIFNCENPSEAWDLCVYIFSTVLDIHAPWKLNEL